MSGTVKIVHPRLPRNEVPWQPEFQYECPGGHTLGAERPVRRCPLGWCGRDLVRVGKGARS